MRKIVVILLKKPIINKPYYNCMNIDTIIKKFVWEYIYERKK